MKKQDFGFWTNISLRKKVALLLAAGLLLGTGVFSFLALNALSRSTDEKLAERLAAAKLEANYTDQMLGVSLRRLEEAATEIKDPSASSAPMDSLQEDLTQFGLSISGLFVLNKNGDIVWPDASKGLKLASEQSKWVVNTKTSSVSGWVLTDGWSQRSVFLSGVSPGDKGFIVVAAIDISKSNIRSFVSPPSLGQTSYAEIVDEYGTVLVRTSPGQPPTFYEQSARPEHFASLIEERKPTTGTCHNCHVEGQQISRRKDVLAFAPLNSASWGVVIGQSEKEAMALTRELRWKLLGTGAAMMSIFLGLVWFGTSGTLRRTRELNRASQKMAEGDLSQPIPSCGKDEIGTLAQTLEDTRVKLRASHEAIARQTKELASLLAVSKTLTSVPDFSLLPDAVVKKVVELIKTAEAGALILYERETGEFRLQAIVGVDGLEHGIWIKSQPPDSIRIPCRSLSEQTTETNELTAKSCAALFALEPFRTAAQSAICAPLVSKTKYLGSIILTSFSLAEAFTDYDLNLLHTMAHDITLAVENVQLSRQAEEARVLRESDRVKSDFISMVSHELRTPLTSIKGYTTSLLRSDVTWNKETTDEFLRTIDEKTDELRDLIGKLLQMAKVEAGVLEIRKEPVLIKKTVDKLVKEMSSNHPRHTFKIEFASSLPVVEADSYYIEILLRNILDNAVKYSPDGGEIKVRGWATEDRVTIAVSDGGIGIPATQLKRIFDRFYRVDSKQSRGIAGSGLGLSIVKALVEAHGGEVCAESTEGKGSTIYFWLPLGKDEGETDEKGHDTIN